MTEFDNGFDLDNFIGEVSDVFAAKHPPEGRTDQGSQGRITRAFSRAKKQNGDRDVITRRLAPKIQIKGNPND